MTIAIVDDHQLILDGFVKAVKEHYPDAIIHTKQDEQGLFDLLAEAAVDILFLDIRLRRADARDFMKKIRSEHSSLKIVIISSLDDLPTIETLFKQGADGYLLKSDPRTEIPRAIETTYKEKKKFVSKGIEAKYYARHLFQTPRTTLLTPREKDILSLILKGKTTKDIAQALFISEKTVENHRTNLFIKFDVKNVASLVKKAILEGYL